jgi:hypothetical protein
MDTGALDFFNKKLILDYYFCLKSGLVFLFQISIFVIECKQVVGITLTKSRHIFDFLRHVSWSFKFYLNFLIYLFYQSK